MVSEVLNDEKKNNEKVTIKNMKNKESHWSRVLGLTEIFWVIGFRIPIQG